ncbi:transglutaminase-like domain-containing protein [Sediminibacillus massiliensis]|uniref:transglutaminase-like domain-containing protein n=1 Tax=Sediminibacillus massiliensis TaxID=1926277 RepID=UPI0009883E57|nr:transglutaminase family protein [Sediminibacillus massiliensis]
MNLICEYSDIEYYLKETKEVDFNHPAIRELSEGLFVPAQTEVSKVKNAYEYVRDQVNHSWDIQAPEVTKTASEVLLAQHGICYSKTMLLAALLRSQGIASGFCYQRLQLFDTPEKGYCIHALNAVYLETVDEWIRLDARGNKQGVEAEFSIYNEKLAFNVNEQLDEKDYPVVYCDPHPATTGILQKANDAVKMYKHHLPNSI